MKKNDFLDVDETLSEEDRAIRDAVRTYVRAELAPHVSDWYEQGSIPIDIAKECVAKILATATATQKGRVERSDIGLDLKPLQGFEQFYSIDINRGVLIESVDRGSPAAKAGVMAQDILLEMNGEATNARFPEEIAPLRKRIGDLPIGSEVHHFEVLAHQGGGPIGVMVVECVEQVTNEGGIVLSLHRGPPASPNGTTLTHWDDASDRS